MVGDHTMSVIGIGVSLMAMLTACATERYPLLEEDGRYKGPRPVMVASAETSTPVAHDRATSSSAVQEQDMPAPIAPMPRGFTPLEGTITPPRIEGEAAPRQRQPAPVDLVAGETVPTPQAARPTSAAPTTAASVEEAQRAAAERALEAVNALRVANNQPALTLSTPLSEIAKAHVVELAVRGEESELAPRQGQVLGERKELR